MKFDIFKMAEHIPNLRLRRKVLDYTFSWAIPFNKGLGLKLKEVSPSQVTVFSSPLRRRQNHVGGAHACYLALMGEYAAGLCLAQNYSPEKFRMIIGSLKMTYHKQGRSALSSTAKKPSDLISFEDALSKGEFWVPMRSEITNDKSELIATCETEWQIKAWEEVRS